jgi:DeoR/GlpR family transcriptional regulator of sugar metabolism
VASRSTQRAQRQRAIADAVLAEGSVRIDALAERFGISLMTAHRDLDEMEARGLLHKSRGAATALPSSLVESSDVYRRGQQLASKRALARAAMRYLEPGQAVIIDDSTTTFAMAPMLAQRAPLTVITNYLPLMNEVVGQKGIELVGLCGQYYGWAGGFLGGLTNDALARLRADVVVMSTSAVVDGTCYHQTRETVDTKRAMLGAAATRLLLVDHTKFERRALHALAPLTDFDHVIVDALTPEHHREDLRSRGVPVTVVPLDDAPDPADEM